MIELTSAVTFFVASMATSFSPLLHVQHYSVCLTSSEPSQMHAYHKPSQKVPASGLSRLARLATGSAGEQADDHGGGDDVHQDQDGSLSV
jgi:hypothetical protein